jgi:transketolase
MTKSTAQQIRRVILEQSKRANVGHIGSALSIADIIAALYDGALRVGDPKDLERDRFVLSKGHAMLAVYAALFLRGWLRQDDLNTYCVSGRKLLISEAVPDVEGGSGTLNGQF